MTITRRAVLANSAFVLLGAMTGRSSFAAAESDLQGQEFRLATYGGSYRDGIEKFFISPLSERGLSTEYILGNPDDHLAKVIAAKRSNQIPFDLMDGSALTYPKAYKAGFYEKLDYSRIPGSENSPEWAREEGQVVTVWAQDGIVYNQEKFSEAGIKPPESYLDLRDPKLKGRVAFPAPSNVFHWAAVVGLAYEGGGREANMEPAIPLVKEIAPAYFYTSSAEVATKLGAGDIWAAPLGGGWAVRLKRSGLPFAVTFANIENRKGALWPGPLSIIKGTKNLEGSYAYLTQWYSVEKAAQFCAATGNVAVDPATRQRVAELDPLAKEMLPLSDSAIDNMYRVAWDKLDADQWRAVWNREI